MEIYTLDTSCALNLLKHNERPDEDLLRLMRSALRGRATVCTTGLVEIEASQGVVEANTDRLFLRQRLCQFPVLAVSAEREPERDRLAQEFLAALWPNSRQGTRQYEHNLRDCKHLASHDLCGGSVFVTLDQELLRKVRLQGTAFNVKVMSPSEALALAKLPASDQVHVSEDSTLAVRRAGQDEYGDIKALLSPLRETYSDFDAWLKKAFTEEATEVHVEVAGQEIVGVAIWKPKDRRTVKLSTFYVSEPHRARGYGQHLLFHLLRSWVDAKCSKVIVTLSTKSSNLLPFFIRYGFRIEGASGRRYDEDSTEYVLAKHLIFQRITASMLPNLTALAKVIFAIDQPTEFYHPGNWFSPPTPVERVEWDNNHKPTLVLKGPEGHIAQRYSLQDLEEILYPARFALPDRKGYLIPIQPRWAEQMLQFVKAQQTLWQKSETPLLLRTDNAYYCHPRYTADDLRGAPVLFYFSSPEKNLAGMGRILDCRIATPEELFLEFSDLGIYRLDDIRNHVKTSGETKGRAMALRFGWWVPFRTTINKDQLGQFGVAYPQTITAVPYETYEALIRAGGIEW